MLSHHKLARFLLLPELKLLSWNKETIAANIVDVEKESQVEICPKCATPSHSRYDYRWITIKDAPVRGSSVKLRIKKRRFYCKHCRKPFTEPVQGISKGQRTTQRYRRTVLWACENFSDLKRVRKTYRCSSGFIYQTLYEQIDLRLRRTTKMQ